MSSKRIYKLILERKENYLEFINNIKLKYKADFFTIVNTTLLKNPFNHSFPLYFCTKKYYKKNQLFLFLKVLIRFYLKQFLYFSSYIIAYLIFRLFFKKRFESSQKVVLFDIPVIVDKINASRKFEENYFSEAYAVFKKFNVNYAFLPRLYGVSKNPLKLIKLFKVLTIQKEEFLFEYQLLRVKDFLEIFILIILYPFKTLRLLQEEVIDENKLFNIELIGDIEKTSFEVFSRYIFGKNVATYTNVEKVYSWSEFLSIERSFNYGVRITNDNIKLYGCQFYINYDTYFNTINDDIDFEQKTSYHYVLVNGKCFLKNRDKIIYKKGISLRYKKLYDFIDESSENKNILVLGSYLIDETKNILSKVKKIKSEKVYFKSHPLVSLNSFDELIDGFNVTNKDIYKLFKNTNIVIGSGSGTLIEAVSCGISVIVLSSESSFTANPLLEYGKGKIWDIAFSENDVEIIYNILLEFREKNKQEINEISKWYKDNFFVEPSEKNIIKTFDLDKE